MPIKKKKKFINKKDAVSFHLVHRSQKDPLQASEEASKHVLVQDRDDIAKKKEEERKFGVFFDDAYNYLQHLKEADEVYEVPAEFDDILHISKEDQEDSIDKGPKLTLPASVFASEFEKPVGLLNQAVTLRGPQLDWDPDIVAGLDDDFDIDNPDNQLEDDFIEMANAPVGEKEDEGSDLETVSDIASDDAAMSGSDDFDADFQYGDKRFMDEETKSRFTDYSMSSSVMRRSEGLSLLDDRFEKLYEGYGDEEIGALDQEEIDGTIRQGSEVLTNIMDEFERQQKLKTLKEVVDEKAGGGSVNVANDESSSDSEELVTVETKQERWDCESILSTYSNLYNHPKLIQEPKKINLKGRHGLPEGSLQQKKGLTEAAVTEAFGSMHSDKASTYRPKDEAAEERAERKKAVKQERRERRAEKKMNKQAFTQEKIRQDKEMVNLKNNLKTVKIM